MLLNKKEKRSSLFKHKAKKKKIFLPFTMMVNQNKLKIILNNSYNGNRKKDF